MTITTYSELQTAVGSWLDRANLTSRIPEFITLAEAEFQRVLRTDDMEVRAAATADGEYLALPNGFKAMRSLTIDGSEYAQLEQMSLARLRTAYSSRATGRPRNYAIADSQIVLGPPPDESYALEMVYTAKFTPLSDEATSNWILTEHPDLYLWASIAQAEFYIGHDERLPLVKSRADEIVDQINREALKKRSGGSPVRMRIAVNEMLP